MQHIFVFDVAAVVLGDSAATHQIGATSVSSESYIVNVLY